jgi:hypothetical protein
VGSYSKDNLSVQIPHGTVSITILPYMNPKKRPDKKSRDVTFEMGCGLHTLTQEMK